MLGVQQMQNVVEMAKRKIKFLDLILPVVLTLFLLLLNLRLHGPSYNAYALPNVGPDILAQLRFIRSSLDGGSAEEMQNLFPEGYFFSEVLYGLTWVEVARRPSIDAARRNEAIKEIEYALDHIKSDKGLEVFNPDLSPQYGIFYQGWTAWLEGGLLMIQNENERSPNVIDSFERRCSQLAKCFDTARTPFLETYADQCWPVDNLTAIAALRLHDQLFPPKYSATIDAWVSHAKALVDPKTGLLPHKVEVQSGQLTQGTRGSSQAMGNRLLIEIDPVWGAEQYSRFRKLFISPLLGLPGTLEYPAGSEGIGDVDSGPLVFGVSSSASVVAIAAAQANRDDELVNEMIPSSEAAGLPFSWGNSKCYAFGLLPIGDEFLAWAKTTSPWINQTNPPVPYKANPFWRMPYQAASLFVIVLVWLRVILQKKAKRSFKRRSVQPEL